MLRCEIGGIDTAPAKKYVPGFVLSVRKGTIVRVNGVLWRVESGVVPCYATDGAATFFFGAIRFARLPALSRQKSMPSYFLNRSGGRTVLRGSNLTLGRT